MPISDKIKDISILGIGEVVGTVIAGIFWFFLATELGPESYGEISFLVSIAQVAAIISLLGAAQTLVVYGAKKIKINSTIFTLTLIVGFILSTIVFFIFTDIGTSLYIFGLIAYGLVSAELAGKKLFRTNAKLHIVQRIMMIIISLGLYFLIGESGIIMGIAISHLIYLPKIISSLKENPIKLFLIRERLDFIIASYSNTLIAGLSTTLDKILIGPLLGFVILGNYSLGIQFFGLLIMIPMVVFRYLLPHDANGVDNKRLKKFIILISIGLAFLGFTIGPEIISLFFSEFSDASDILRIMSLAVIPYSITLLYQTKFIANEKSKRFLGTTLAKTGTLVSLLVILGTFWGIIGVTIAFVLSFVVGAIFSYFSDKKNWLN